MQSLSLKRGAAGSVEADLPSKILKITPQANRLPPQPEAAPALEAFAIGSAVAPAPAAAMGVHERDRARVAAAIANLSEDLPAILAEAVSNISKNPGRKTARTEEHRRLACTVRDALRTVKLSADPATRKAQLGRVREFLVGLAKGGSRSEFRLILCQSRFLKELRVSNPAIQASLKEAFGDRAEYIPAPLRQELERRQAELEEVIRRESKDGEPADRLERLCAQSFVLDAKADIQDHLDGIASQPDSKRPRFCHSGKPDVIALAGLWQSDSTAFMRKVSEILSDLQHGSAPGARRDDQRKQARCVRDALLEVHLSDDAHERAAQIDGLAKIVKKIRTLPSDLRAQLTNYTFRTAMQANGGEIAAVFAPVLE